MKTKNKLLGTSLLVAVATTNLLYAQSSSEKLVEKVTQSITSNKEETFKENILKKVDEKISQSYNSSPGVQAPATISEEVEKSYEEKRKEYPVMIGGYKITKKGSKYPVYSSATVVDSENNVYSLTNTNNKVVKSIRKDYIDYKEKDGTFRSTMVHHHLRDDEKKISLKASSVNVLEPTPVKRTEAEPKTKLPTLEEVVSDFKK
jgi:hypothetical protein